MMMPIEVHRVATSAYHIVFLRVGLKKGNVSTYPFRLFYWPGLQEMILFPNEAIDFMQR